MYSDVVKDLAGHAVRRRGRVSVGSN